MTSRPFVVLVSSIVLVLLHAPGALADTAADPPIDADAIAPAVRIADPPQPEPELVAPPGSRCPELYAIAVEHWPGAALHWPVLDHILWRESRCRPGAVNRYGCVGLLQICRGNHRRMGVTRLDLMDPATNIAVGYRLCAEWLDVGRSCWRPWWLGRWRP